MTRTNNSETLTTYTNMGQYSLNISDDYCDYFQSYILRYTALKVASSFAGGSPTSDFERSKERDVCCCNSDPSSPLGVGAFSPTRSEACTCELRKRRSRHTVTAVRSAIIARMIHSRPPRDDDRCLMNPTVEGPAIPPSVPIVVMSPNPKPAASLGKMSAAAATAGPGNAPIPPYVTASVARDAPNDGLFDEETLASRRKPSAATRSEPPM